MKARTGDVARRLKRLAKRYARAYADRTRMGSRMPEEFDAIEEEHNNARKALFDEIDSLVGQIVVEPS